MLRYSTISPTASRQRKHSVESELFLKRSQEVGRIGSLVIENFGSPISSQTWTGTPVIDEILGIDGTYPRTSEKWLDLLVRPQELIDTLKRQIMDKRGMIEMEYQIVRPRDGQTRWIFSRGEVEYDDLGKPTRLIGTILDVTERKKRRGRAGAARKTNATDPEDGVHRRTCRRHCP